MEKLPASTGWHWLKQGFALFRKQPGILTMLLFVNLMITLVISSVPYIGPLIAAILVPSVSISVMQACFEIEQDQRVGPRVILTGFRQPALRALCKLGMVYLGASLVLTVMAQFMVDPEVVRQVSAPVAAGANPAPPNMQALLMILLIQLLALVVLVALSFSIPLTYWQRMPAGKATFYSVFAIAGAIKPILVLLLSWFGLLMGVGTIIAVIMGSASAGRVILAWLVLLAALMLQCAIYAAYRQIFGDPAVIEHAEPK